jgi:phenylacetate-CoA ligase
VLALLATYIHDLALVPPRSVRVITTGAESLSPAQRNHIERAFGAKVVEHYGQAESVANISECEKGSMHVDEDYSLVEFEALNGAPGRYRIIGSCWTNLAFPLLRYDTGDVATLEPGALCTCSRNGRIVQQIDGRIEDYLVLPNGVKIGRLDHIFKDCINIREAQIHQARNGCITFRVVKGVHYSAADEQQLENEARKRLGSDVRFGIEYCETIPKTASGKLRFVVSEFAKEPGSSSAR